MSVVAFGCNIAAVYQADDVKLKRWNFVASLLWSIVLLMHGAHTAFWVGMVSTIRHLIASFTQNFSIKQRSGLFSILFLATAAATALTWQGILSLLPATASLISTYSNFFLRNSWLRVSNIATMWMWGVNAYLFSVWFQVATTFLMTFVQIYGYRKNQMQYGHEPKKFKSIFSKN